MFLVGNIIIFESCKVNFIFNIMVRIENQIVQKVTSEMFSFDTSLYISGCIIELLDFDGLELKEEIIIEKSIIKRMKIHACSFVGGLSLKNCLVLSDVDYQMGGHNKAQILLDGNIFNGFFSFFDCHFEEQLKVTNNIFVKNCDLFVLEGKGFDNTFEKDFVVKDNIGRLDVFESIDY